MDSENKDNPGILLMPAAASTEISMIQPGGPIRLLGLFAGIIYCGVVVWISDQMAFRMNAHGFFETQMPLRLSMPIVPQFGAGLTVGLLVLMLVIVLLRRIQRNLAIGLLPGAGALLLIVISFMISIPPSGFKSPRISGGPMRMTPQEKSQ